MEFSQPELYAALDAYIRDEGQVVAEASASVVEWKYSREPMTGPIPFHDAIGFRGESSWKPREAGWLATEPDGFWYKHGFDAEGDLRIIFSKAGFPIVFRRDGQTLDEIRYRAPGTSSFVRHLLRDEVTQVKFECTQEPEQYDREEFEFDSGRCVRSVMRAWFVDDDAWEETSWQTIRRYECDHLGLLRVYQDQGEVLGNNVLLYARRGSSPGLRDKFRERRPLVAYAIAIAGADAPEYQVYSDAYGLEMTIDDEWPIDTVVLTKPELVHVVTSRTGVTFMGTVFAGAVGPAEHGKLKADGGSWLLVSAPAPEPGELDSAWDAGLSIILLVRDREELAHAMRDAARSDGALVVALQTAWPCSPEQAQKQAAAIRDELRKTGREQSRIVLAARLNDQAVIDYLSQPDVDGVFLANSNAGTVEAILRRIAIHAA